MKQCDFSHHMLYYSVHLLLVVFNEGISKNQKLFSDRSEDFKPLS